MNAILRSIDNNRITRYILHTISYIFIYLSIIYFFKYSIHNNENENLQLKFWETIKIEVAIEYNEIQKWLLPACKFAIG
jgi:hypothetical protein